MNSLLANQSAPLNSPFAIKCYVRGDPPPTVKWTKDGLVLRNYENTLTIDNMTFKDAGWYGCSAENRAGKIQRDFWIDVTGMPLFKSIETRGAIYSEVALTVFYQTKNWYGSLFTVYGTCCQPYGKWIHSVANCFPIWNLSVVDE